MTLGFSNQFAVGIIGLTMAAILVMLYTVRIMLTENDFVPVFSFDFSNAFNMTRHVCLTTNFAMCEILDCVFNWVIDISNS